MGSLRIIQHINDMNVTDEKVYKKKPLQNLLGVFKSSNEADPHHSPLGSPSVEKKRLRRLSNSLLASKKSPSGVTLRSLEEKENMNVEDHHMLQAQSILKRTAPKPTCAITYEPTHCSHNRHVVFNGHVLVQYIGDSETSMEPLNTEFHDRQGFIARNALRRLQSQAAPCQSVCIDSLGSSSSTAQLPTFQNSYNNGANNKSSDSQNNGTGKDVTISFSQNNRNATVMKFVVFMGPQYDPANIVVKANMSGNRLRVVANLMNSGLNGVEEQYNERFQLPMQVDPYKVEARLDGRGYLTVNAPIIEQTGSISI